MMLPAVRSLLVTCACVWVSIVQIEAQSLRHVRGSQFEYQGHRLQFDELSQVLNFADPQIIHLVNKAGNANNMTSYFRSSTFISAGFFVVGVGLFAATSDTGFLFTPIPYLALVAGLGGMIGTPVAAVGWTIATLARRKRFRRLANYYNGLQSSSTYGIHLDVGLTRHGVGLALTF